MGSVHKFDYGHKFAGAASASVMAGGVEAGDCCGLAGAGVLGTGGGAPLRCEREPVRGASAIAKLRISRRVRQLLN